MQYCGDNTSRQPTYTESQVHNGNTFGRFELFTKNVALSRISVVGAHRLCVDVVGFSCTPLVVYLSYLCYGCVKNGEINDEHEEKYRDVYSVETYNQVVCVLVGAHSAHLCRIKISKYH